MVRANTYGTSAPAASDNSAVGYGYNPGFLAKASRSSDVSIRYLSELSQAEKASFQDRAKLNPASVKAIRSEISSNASLVKGLHAQNVNVQDVIGASRAADGSVTYIIR